ncbi:NrdA Ribonucleotide reductase, alpha subunit [uncultured Caudovirales phage]|uniref:Ribonucleoside-diphosphate reductase n=1 Tax=uncultured Caudovirales phage TaxID=2100421 RepID=A0A6J5LGM1_9CAUD|nr:NrdA Ribonucleotide reductase, alpha subunit [uncultured Caudovirales phage]
MTQIQVTKRDGRREPLDIEKMHKVVMWATEGITGVSASEVEIKSHIQFYNGIKTADIQETIIKSAADLISEETPNYQYVAGRLINYHLRKQVYGDYTPLPIIDLVNRNVESGFYDRALLDAYSSEEWDKLNSFIHHERDENFTYVAMEQWRGKYLVQNRVTGEIFETPQVAYLLIAATLFQNYSQDTRLRWVKDYYDAISLHDISLPTPVMAGVRTPQKQFSSCVLIEADDSLDSINATTSSIVKYVSQKAGIGIGAGRIRALGSPIRNGDAYHTGVIPFYKMFQAATRSCSQGGVRNGAATLYYPIWHLEIEDLLVLKNNKGTEDNRVRHMDYGVQFNKLMYERLITGGDITCFSPNDVPEMYAAFFNNQDRFRELYERAERNTKLRKKTYKAADLFSRFMQERKDTGRVYLQNVDHANTHSPFDEAVAPIKMSNLCAEIDLPTVPLRDVNDEDGRIALCTLSAINWGNVKSPHDFKKMCTLAVRGLDALLSYQNYPILAARLATEDFRPLGIGIINFAYFLAKNDVSYTDDHALALVDEYAEAWSYYLIKASADLAEEQGACARWKDLKSANGILPIDTRKMDVDELVPYQERMPWNELREQVKRTGQRNATLMALMPAETSAQISNATNGIEPPRSYVSIKGSKHGQLKQVVPEYRKLKNKYELLWDQTSPEGYLKLCAVLQKYIDQGISVNTSYNPQHYSDEKIPMSEMLQHILMCYKYGLKQLYYFNTYDGQGEINVDKMTADIKLEDQAAQAIDQEDCDSCVI